MDQAKKQFTFKQKLQFTAVIVAVLLVVIFVLGEVVLRITAKPTEYSNKSVIHEQLGWVPKADYQASYKVKNYGKDAASYDVNYYTEMYGFRSWGDPETNKKKVFFIGDSFTQSVEASNKDVFYRHIGDSLDIEVFAFGQAGYGTLQQKLIVDLYFDIIKPDLLVWQVCDNDFVDNYAPLEYNSGYKVGLRRPYMTTDGEIIYRKPVPEWQEVVDKSKFLALVRKKLQNTFSSKETVTCQKLITDLNKKYPPYAESIAVTDRVVSTIKATIGETPVIAFSASRFEPSLTNMTEIFEHHGIPMNNKLGRQVFDENKRGSTIHSRDGYHWNPKGQKYVADLLIPDIANALARLDSEG